jgi:hypothetical protein
VTAINDDGWVAGWVALFRPRVDVRALNDHGVVTAVCRASTGSTIAPLSGALDGSACCATFQATSPVGLSARTLTIVG